MEYGLDQVILAVTKAVFILIDHKKSMALSSFFSYSSNFPSPKMLHTWK